MKSRWAYHCHRIGDDKVAGKALTREKGIFTNDCNGRRNDQIALQAVAAVKSVGLYALQLARKRKRAVETTAIIKRALTDFPYRLRYVQITFKTNTRGKSILSYCLQSLMKRKRAIETRATGKCTLAYGFHRLWNDKVPCKHSAYIKSRFAYARQIIRKR